MLLNMIMFKVTICDFGKMNINMTDKIEKRRQPLQCRTMARTTTIMSMARASAAMTAAWRLRRHVLWHEQRRTTSKKAIHTRRCSSTTTQTIWVAVVSVAELRIGNIPSILCLEIAHSTFLNENKSGCRKAHRVG